MRRKEYLLTREGAITNYLSRFISNLNSYEIKGNPLSKNSMNYDERLKFQLEFIKQMKKNRKRAYRENAEICIDMRIFTNADNPPHIQTIPKNYLDLLSKPIDSSKIGRKNILFNDDKQVSYLNVAYEMENIKNPRIEFTVYKFKHLIEDIRLAQAILSEDHMDEDNIHGVIDEFTGEEKWFSDVCKDYLDYVNKDGIYRCKLMDLVELSKVQNALFCKNRLSLYEMYILLCDSIPYRATIDNTTMNIYKECKKKYNSLYSNGSEKNTNPFRRLDGVFRIKIDKLPKDKGDTKLLKEKIRCEMKEFKSKYSFLDQLVVPVSLKVLYKPSGHYISHKDLDNIMKIIVPIFHEEFKPPISIYSSNYLEEDDTNRNIPKGINYQIRGYEIIKIPRTEGDCSDGYIIIGISNYDSLGLIWRANKVIIDD